jgi:phage tail-like protein
MATGREPARAFPSRSFLLEIDGISNAAFSRCLGLEACVEVLEYPEGGVAEPRRLRGDLVYGPLLLERGLSSSRELFDWFQRGDARDGAVILIDSAGRECVRWEFVRGWPAAWEGPALEADRGAVALERLELVHEGLRWAEC